jgi:ribonuclease inhibitor
MMAEPNEQVTIDLSAVTTSDELHALLTRSLDFPDFYGNNWSAFWDAITGLVPMPRRMQVVGWSEFAARMPDESRQLRSCLEDALTHFPEWSAQIEYN